MQVRETLVNLGYEKAGVLLEDDTMNQLENFLHGATPPDAYIGDLFKYFVVLKYKPEWIGDDAVDYSNQFWKIYPEGKK